MLKKMISRFCFTALLGCVCIANAQSKHNNASGMIAFEHVNVIPMDKDTVLKNQTVLIKSETITEIGNSQFVNVPHDAQRIDGTNKFLLPGFIDLHVHISSITDMIPFFTRGVTTVFNLGGNTQHLVWREKIAKGELVGPTLFTCGPAFNFPRTEEQAIQEVERQSRAGYDGIKIYNGISKEEYPAVIRAAKQHHMLIIGHVPTPPGIEMALASGQNVAHAEEYVYGLTGGSVVPLKEGMLLGDDKIAWAVEHTLNNGVSVVATLVMYDHIIQQVKNLTRYLQKPEKKYLSAYYHNLISPENNKYAKRFDTTDIPGLEYNFLFQQKLMLALHKAGVKVLAGTDATAGGPVGGFGIEEELKNFVQIGFTPYEALRTATIDAAEFLRHGGEFGKIAADTRADLVLLDKNPLEDISNIDCLAGVMLRGRWMPQKELDAMLDSVPDKHKQEIDYVAAQLKTNSDVALKYLDENDPIGIIASEALHRMIVEKEIDYLISFLKEIKRRFPNSVLVNEDAVNNLGYKLLGAKKIVDAIAMFKLNIELYDTSSNAYDSLGEAYASNGNDNLSIQCYKKALELNPHYPNAEAARTIVNKK